MRTSPRSRTRAAVMAAIVSVATALSITIAVAPAAYAVAPEAAIARGKTLLNTDAYGDFGCEDFVDFAYGRTTANGIPHDSARSFYANLVAEGKGHSSLPAPRGALVFSQGQYGYHVDISLGDGRYLSGGVQGLSPGWGKGKNIQVLPFANFGDYTLLGWAYAPWR